MATPDSHSKDQPAIDSDETSQNDNGKTKSVFKNSRFWNPWDTWIEDEPFFSSAIKMMLRDRNNARIPSQAVSC